MKYQTLAVAASLLSTATAFPRMDAEQLETYKRHLEESEAGCPFSQAEEKNAEPPADCPFSGQNKAKRAATFNAEEQRVSVDGEHEFKAPDIEGGDERG